MLIGQKLWLVCEPVDMRKGVDGLTLLIHNDLGMSWQEGNVFIFRNRTGYRIKLLAWDRHGVWLAHRRLHQGRFIWPNSTDKTWKLSQEQFNWLTIGVDWQRLSKPAVDWQIF